MFLKNLISFIASLTLSVNVLSNDRDTSDYEFYLSPITPIKGRFYQNNPSIFLEFNIINRKYKYLHKEYGLFYSFTNPTNYAPNWNSLLLQYGYNLNIGLLKNNWLNFGIGLNMQLLWKQDQSPSYMIMNDTNQSYIIASDKLNYFGFGFGVKGYSSVYFRRKFGLTINTHLRLSPAWAKWKNAQHYIPNKHKYDFGIFPILSIIQIGIKYKLN